MESTGRAPIEKTTICFRVYGQQYPQGSKTAQAGYGEFDAFDGTISGRDRAAGGF